MGLFKRKNKKNDSIYDLKKTDCTNCTNEPGTSIYHFKRADGSIFTLIRNMHDEKFKNGKISIPKFIYKDQNGEVELLAHIYIEKFKDKKYVNLIANILFSQDNIKKSIEENNNYVGGFCTGKRIKKRENAKTKSSKIKREEIYRISRVKKELEEKRQIEKEKSNKTSKQSQVSPISVILNRDNKKEMCKLTQKIGENGEPEYMQIEGDRYKYLNEPNKIPIFIYEKPVFANDEEGRPFIKGWTSLYDIILDTDLKKLQDEEYIRKVEKLVQQGRINDKLKENSAEEKKFCRKNLH